MAGTKPDNPKTCFYYDKEYEKFNWEDGCGHCHECFQFKCPVAVSRMTDEEKAFYGITKEENKHG